jgi:hypothetical protein
MNAYLPHRQVAEEVATTILRSDCSINDYWYIYPDREARRGYSPKEKWRYLLDEIRTFFEENPDSDF